MNKNDMEYLKADVFRINGSTGYKDILKAIISKRCFRPIFTLRMCQYYKKKNYKIRFNIYRLLHKFICNNAGIDIGWNTKIGLGFCITHGWGTVINEKCKIGNNVTIFHGVTLGQKDKIESDGIRTTEYPVIEDNVWIGAGAIILGGVTLGKGSIIAPGSVIVKDVGSSTIVAGNPQRTIKENCNEDVYNKYSKAN